MYIIISTEIIEEIINRNVKFWSPGWMPPLYLPAFNNLRESPCNKDSRNHWTWFFFCPRILFRSISINASLKLLNKKNHPSLYYAFLSIFTFFLWSSNKYLILYQTIQYSSICPIMVQLPFCDRWHRWQWKAWHTPWPLFLTSNV
jgi:hypothetical protein